MRTLRSNTKARSLAAILATFLLPSILIGAAAADQTPASAAEETAAKQKILDACHVSDTETDWKKNEKQRACIERAVKALQEKRGAEAELQSALDQTFGASQGKRLLTPVFSAGPSGQTSQQGQAGGSVSNTPSTCGPGAATTDNALIRVHRVLMAPKNASDDFGYRLGRRYLIYQVTISNDNKDYQYLIHDVSVDLSPFFCPAPACPKPGDYRYTASSQDLTLLRGIPEKGQDLDRRNLILHVLTGIGSVAGAASGLSSFADVMGPSVAVFNGSFLQGYVGIAPDHTGTQLNRLSDSAYITNTLVDKQRARTIAVFVPEATLLTSEDQKEYWKDPEVFLARPDRHLNQADVCVDGAFIATVASPTLAKAILIPKTSGTPLGANAPATLIVQGTNLSTSDTEVVGLGTTVHLANSNGTAGSVDVTLPSSYTSGIQVHLASAANPSVTSAAVATSTMAPPTLTGAVLASQNSGIAPGPGVAATLTVTGTNLTKGDTQVVGLGPTATTLTTVDTNTGSVAVTLPETYTNAGMPVYLSSALVTPYVASFKSDPCTTTATDNTVRVTVCPAAGMLTVGQTLKLNATVTGTTNQQVTWSVTPAGAASGTVSGPGLAGTYTAPAALPAQRTITVTATSAADATRFASATITLH